MRLNNIRQIIFDMDGVITSEYMYWDAAALTVYELMFSREFFGADELDAARLEAEFSRIHDLIFCGNDTIEEVKRLGVNTNWDLAYIVFCVSRFIDPSLSEPNARHFREVRDFIAGLDTLAPELYAEAERLVNSRVPKPDGFYTRGAGELWSDLQDVFQHWFLGTERFRAEYHEPKPPHGRRGLMEFEQPLVPLERVRGTLKALRGRGITLGIGTGRPTSELDVPINMWGIAPLFDAEHCATYTDVVGAEKATGMTGALAKPNPYVFLKAALGKSTSDGDIVAGRFDAGILEKTLVVGDAMSDFLAARAAGAKFAAVLTGVRGKAARGEFEEVGADIVLDDVTELAGAFED